MNNQTPDVMTAPGPSFSFSVKVPDPPPISASIQGQASVFTATAPFEQIRHLLSGKPHIRPKHKSSAGEAG